jgi:hypothetical protein
LGERNSCSADRHVGYEQHFFCDLSYTQSGAKSAPTLSLVRVKSHNETRKSVDNDRYGYLRSAIGLPWNTLCTSGGTTRGTCAFSIARVFIGR